MQCNNLVVFRLPEWLFHTFYWLEFCLQIMVLEVKRELASTKIQRIQMPLQTKVSFQEADRHFEDQGNH